MKTIISAGTPKITVDIPSMIASRGLVTANSGGGKSWLLRKIVEQCAKQVQVIVIDPDGEFVTLREKYDFALIGHGGEVAIDLRSAKLLARKLVEHRIPAIINLSDIDSLDGKREYLSIFLDSLMGVPRKFWHPILIPIDEAHRFCPESGNVSSTRAVITLMDAGRKRGFSGVLATQRISKLHKDAAAEANNIFIGRVWLDNDTARCADLLGLGKKEAGTILRNLKPGQFYTFGPALNVNQPTLFRSGMVETKHPEAGEKQAVTVPAASNTISKIVEQIEDLPAQIEQEENEIVQLKEEVRRLRRELNERPSVAVDKTVIEYIDRPILTDEQVQGLREAAETLRQTSENYRNAAGLVFKESEKIEVETLAIMESMESAQKIAKMDVRPDYDPNDEFSKRKRPMIAVPALEAMAEGVTAPQQRILDAMAWLEDTIRNDHPKRTIVAFLARQSSKSSGYKNNLGALRSAGLLEYAGSDAVHLTDEGNVIAKHDPMPLTADALQTAILSRLPRPQGNILKVLIDRGTNPVDREWLAGESGQSPKSSGYKNNLGALRAFGLIDYAGADKVRALPILFLE